MKNASSLLFIILKVIKQYTCHIQTGKQGIILTRTIEIKPFMTLPMKTYADFLINDANCKIALQELITTESVLGWISKYSYLHNRVTIQPKGLPTIARANLGANHFINITRFHIEYSRLSEIANSITMN